MPGRVLDVGCGVNKFPGAVGIDRNPRTKADVIVELDRFPYPFRDGVFDEVRAIHVIEHVSDVCDPTHKWHLNSYSFRYFGEDNAGFGYYSGARFREISVRVKLLALWRYLGFEFLVNHVPRFRKFWEHYLCFVVRGKVMTFEFEALK